MEYLHVALSLVLKEMVVEVVPETTCPFGEGEEREGATVSANDPPVSILNSIKKSVLLVLPKASWHLIK